MKICNIKNKMSLEIKIIQLNHFALVLAYNFESEFWIFQSVYFSQTNFAVSYLNFKVVLSIDLRTVCHSSSLTACNLITVGIES